jgi:CRP-like cAMP-binding protein
VKTPSVRIYPRSILLSLLGRDPTVAQKFMASLAREVMSLRTRLEVLNIRSASEGSSEDFQKIVVRDLPDLTLLAPAQITIYNKKIVDHTVTADGISGNLADVYIQI